MHRTSRRLTLRPAHYALILAAGLAIAACGGNAPPTQTVNVSVSPSTLKLAPGASAQVTATVTGTTDTGVTWSATNGTVTGTGNTVTYTAPTVEGTFTVTATSVADTSKKAGVSVQVSEGASGLERWVRQFGAHQTDEAAGVVLSSNGTVIAAGTSEWTVPGGTRVGKDDAFLVAFDADGEDAWVVQFGSLEDDEAVGVAIGSDDGVVVAGHTYGLIGAASVGLSDAFIAKYAADGTPVWVTQFGTTNYDWPSAVTVDGSGNVIVVGVTQGLFPGETKPSALDGFVAKFDVDGNQQWVTQFGPGVEVMVEDVAVAADGSIYLVGDTDAAMPGNTVVGDTDGFLARFDPDGEAEWYIHIGTEEYDYASAVTVDGDGNVVVIGGTEGEFATGTPEGRFDVFVFKLTADGDEVWVQQFGSANSDNPVAVTVAGDGTVYVIGDTTGSMPGNTSSGERDVFIAGLDGSNGTINVILQYGESDGDDHAAGVRVATNGDVVIAGTTQGYREPGYVKGGQATNLDVFVVVFGP